MDPTAQKRQRQKRRFFWTLVAAVVLTPLSFALYVTFGPNPPIRISKQTTYITSPLDENGLPDYAAALLADMRKGVTPENNGAIPFLQAMWPANKLDNYSDEELRLLEEELSCTLSSPSQPSESFWSRRMRQAASDLHGERTAALTARGGSATDELLDLAGARPWSDDDLPFATEWLHKHSDHFAKLRQALASPDWYLPCPALIKGGSGSLASFSAPHAGLYRGAARRLPIEAMNHAGEGRLDDAFSSALAVVRLADRARNSPLMIDHLVADAVAGMGLASLRTIVSDARLEVNSLRESLTAVDRLSRKTGFFVNTRHGERYFSLDLAIQASRVGMPPIEGFELETDSTHLFMTRTSIDWNVVLTAINRHHDRLLSATALPTRKQRDDALLVLDDETSTLAAQLGSLHRSPARLLTPRSRGELVADSMLAANLFFNYQDLLDLEDRNRNDYQLTRLVIALAILRAEHGDYPEVLTTMVPDVIPALPNDPFGAPFKYRKLDKGYLLYSMGPNGVDDGGSNAGGETGGYGTQTFEGVEIDTYFGESSDSLSPEEQAAYDLIEQIPEGADDHAIRIPLPIKPWPWEKKPAAGE